MVGDLERYYHSVTKTVKVVVSNHWGRSSAALLKQGRYVAISFSLGGAALRLLFFSLTFFSFFL
jgi:hypothetical protein